MWFRYFPVTRQNKFELLYQPDLAYNKTYERKSFSKTMTRIAKNAVSSGTITELSL